MMTGLNAARSQGRKNKDAVGGGANRQPTLQYKTQWVEGGAIALLCIDVPGAPPTPVSPQFLFLRPGFAGAIFGRPPGLPGRKATFDEFLAQSRKTNRDSGGGSARKRKRPGRVSGRAAFFASLSTPSEHERHRLTPAAVRPLEQRALLSITYVYNASQFTSALEFSSSGTQVYVENGFTLPNTVNFGVSNVSVQTDPAIVAKGQYAVITFATNVSTGIEMDGSGDTLKNLIFDGQVSSSGNPYTSQGITEGYTGSTSTNTLTMVNVNDCYSAIYCYGGTTNNSNSYLPNDGYGVYVASGATYNDSGGTTYYHDAFAAYMGTGNSTLTINGATFQNNYQSCVEDYGGLSVTLDNDYFTGNTNSNAAGTIGACLDMAINQNPNGVANLWGDYFTGTTGLTAIYADMTGSSTRFTLGNSTYYNNSAGFVLLSYVNSPVQGVSSLYNDAVINNTLTASAFPLLETDGGTVYVTGCNFAGNNTPGPVIDAGGTFVAGSFNMYQTSVNWNTINNNGGGYGGWGVLYVAPGSAGDKDWITCDTFAGNVDYHPGGAVGVYNEGPSSTIVAIQWCTIVYNESLNPPGTTSNGYGGGINAYDAYGDYLYLTSSIVWGNYAATAYNDISAYAQGATAIATDGHNFVGDPNGANGVVSSDLANGRNASLGNAIFDNRNPYTVARPYVLEPNQGSPLVGHGNPWSWQNGLHDGINIVYTSYPNMTGAIDEFNGTSPAAAVKAASSVSHTVAASTTPAAASASVGAPLTMAIDLVTKRPAIVSAPTKVPNSNTVAAAVDALVSKPSSTALGSTASTELVSTPLAASPVVTQTPDPAPVNVLETLTTNDVAMTILVPVSSNGLVNQAVLPTVDYNPSTRTGSLLAAS